MSPRPVSPLPLAVGGLIATAAAIGIGRFIYTPILPAMVEALGLTKSEAGLIASANYAGYLAGSLSAAFAWGKDDARRFLLAFLVVSGISTAAMAVASTPLLFLLLRFVGGFASAYVLVLSSSLVLNRLVRAGAPGYFYLHFGGPGSGIIASAVVVWTLSAAGADWRAMWLWSGLLCLAAVVPVASLVPPDDARPVRKAAQIGISEADRQALWRITIAYGLVGFGYIITATFIVAIVRASPQARPLEPLFWLVVGLAAVPSVWVWAMVGRRIGTTRAYAAACLVLGVGVIASVASTTMLSLILACVLTGGTFVAITALGLVALGDRAPEARDWWIAIATSAFSVGQIAGPIVAGYGYDLTGSFLLPSLAAATALAVSAGLTFNLGQAATLAPKHSP